MAIKQPEPLSRADFDEAMVRLRLNISAVAKDTDIPRTYLSEFRNGDRRLRPENLAKLRDYFETKGIVFGEATAADTGSATDADADGRAAGFIESVKAKRFFFPVADEVSDETLSSTLATIRANDKKLSDLLTLAAEREEVLFGFGEGDYTEEVQQAFRDAFSLLAINYLMVRAVGGWPEIGLSASNESLTGNTVLAAIVAGSADLFEQAKLPGMSIAEQQEEEVEL